VPRPATGRSLQPPFKSSRQKREATFQAPWVPRDRELYFIIRAGDRVKAAASMASYLDDSERLLTAVLRATRPEQPHRKRRTPASPELRS
jgi:DNA-binding FadR family transcriptional regulator